MSINKILVPIDGSAASKKAAEKAIEFAGKSGSTITFLTVVTIPNMHLDGGYTYSGEASFDNMMMQRTVEVGGKMLDGFIEQLNLEGIDYEKKVAEGEAYLEILEVAGNCEYDYIIMGRRGYSKITRFFVGSVTQRVISESPCPVIVVNE